MSPDIVNLIINVFSGICIIIALVQLIGILLVRYSKNYHLIALYFTCILFLAPWYARAYGNRGFARLNLKEFDESMKDCNRAIKLNSDLYWVYNNRGVIHMQAKRYKEALIDFDRSIKLKADYQFPYTNSFFVNMKLKHYEQALANIDALLAIKGTAQQASLYRSRGIVYAFLKEYTRAIQDFDRSLELDPNFASSYHDKGFTYLRMGDIQNGYASITQAFTLKPNHIHLNWSYEWCKMCMEQPNDTTAEHFEKLSELEPENHIAYVSRGAALVLRGNFESAIKELEQAIMLDPDSEDAYFWTSIAYASQGYDEEALVALQQAQKMNVPEVLMRPLYLLEETQPVFFEKYAKQFLTT